ncbi:MAG: hypothetical protein ABIH72_04335 [archaeon]
MNPVILLEKTDTEFKNKLNEASEGIVKDIKRIRSVPDTLQSIIAYEINIQDVGIKNIILTVDYLNGKNKFYDTSNGNHQKYESLESFVSDLATYFLRTRSVYNMNM